MRGRNKNSFKKLNFKSNKGFTMQDLIVAIMVLLLFVGTIGTTFISIYRIQADTQVDEVVTLYAIQIVEYVDKISYEEVVNNMENDIIARFNIPDKINVHINVSDYKPETNSEDLIKQVSVSMDYTFNKQERNITINRLKIKEL